MQQVPQRNPARFQSQGLWREATVGVPFPPCLLQLRTRLSIFHLANKLGGLLNSAPQHIMVEAQDCHAQAGWSAQDPHSSFLLPLAHLGQELTRKPQRQEGKLDL